MFVIKHLSLIPSKLFFAFSGLAGIVTGLIGIGFLIGFHELGHFLFAKLFNVRTPSFSIGFGPQLISKKIGDTQFSLSALPLGGYVELAGSAEIGQGGQKEAQATDAGSFKSKPFYQKFLVMSGGILFNLAFAYFAFSAIFKLGMEPTPYLQPLYANRTIDTVEEKSPASLVGLKPGDTILAIDGKKIDNALDFLHFIGSNPNKMIELEIETQGIILRKEMTIGSKSVANQTVGFLGVTLQTKKLEPQPLFTAIRNGVALTNRIIASTAYSFKNIFQTKDFSQVRGPLFLIAETVKGASKGWQNLIIFLAIVSINLAVLNLLPLPILDGGQILLYGIEALIGKSLPIKIREYIFIATWIALLSLILYLSSKDILGFLKLGSK